MRTATLLAMAMAPTFALAQMSGPPMGAVDRFLAPPTNVQQDFLGMWHLTWQDPVNPDCPCHATLTIQMEANGDLRGTWPLKGGAAVLVGGVAFDGNAWAGTFAQSPDLDFPIKGHFRLETRSGGLTGSYQRDGTAIPYSWSATRR